MCSQGKVFISDFDTGHVDREWVRLHLVFTFTLLSQAGNFAVPEPARSLRTHHDAGSGSAPLSLSAAPPPGHAHFSLEVCPMFHRNCNSDPLTLQCAQRPLPLAPRSTDRVHTISPVNAWLHLVDVLGPDANHAYI